MEMGDDCNRSLVPRVNEFNNMIMHIAKGSASAIWYCAGKRNELCKLCRRDERNESGKEHRSEYD